MNKLNVTKTRGLWWTISSLAILGSIIAMIISYTQLNAPLRPGLDFVGGTRLQVERDCSIAGNCDRPIEVTQVREVLDAQGLTGSSIQLLGDNKQILSVRTQNLDVNARTELQQALSSKIGQFDPKTIQIDSVGPTIGQELFSSGLLALIVSFFGIIVYLSVRFQFDYAFFAIVALFHDVVVTCGVFAVLGLVAGVEVDSLFLVSLLTIVGFSVNDTVVIYDRIRETMAINPNDSIDQIVDDAVNQTLARSINTSLTTVLPLVAIFFFGGATLKYFALALIIGFIAGAYSSIFVASTLLGWWRNSKKNDLTAIANSSTSD
ncbi:protein translocase subunit secF [Stanieria cyanosphaera PCC 7437]|uniref:Protein-export membrane protein SecF n=1 Tax=Stanieria cyanosphaera (strain ATCC 29371 / PCC 7437) TaxID=111780 RepID=K9XWZ6_STAC7|nr:protein translocase subunit SecF [Stanieria cyanosphaera]AFZ37125.1 protein translocase subunit secF [Stanieria cyanosphaera PCC 7437]